MNRDTMEANAVLSSSIIEDINGIETIKSLTSESQRYQKIDKEFVDYLKKSFTYSRAEKSAKGSEKKLPISCSMSAFSGWELFWSWMAR